MTTTTHPIKLTRESHPYRVRKQSAGDRGTFATWITVKLPGGGRVTTWPHCTRSGALAEADELNIGAMVKDYVDDPRPYAERLAEARAAYVPLPR